MDGSTDLPIGKVSLSFSPHGLISPPKGYFVCLKNEEPHHGGNPHSTPYEFEALLLLLAPAAVTFQKLFVLLVLGVRSAGNPCTKNKAPSTLIERNL